MSRNRQETGSDSECSLVTDIEAADLEAATIGRHFRMPEQNSPSGKWKTRPVAIGLLALAALGIVILITINLLLGEFGGGKNGGLVSVADETAVAATVNGVKIMEQEVTERIETMRMANPELSDITKWAEHLGNSGQTPESFRSGVIEDLISVELTRQAADEAGITISDEEIDAQLEQIRSGFTSEDQLIDMLARSGQTPQSYRKLLALSIMQNKLQEQLLTEDATANYFSSMAERRENADIFINPLPEGLPYDVEPISEK